MSEKIESEIIGIGSKDWLARADKIGLDLNEALFQDKNRIGELLKRYNLPRIKIMNIDDSHKHGIMDFLHTNTRTPILTEISDFLSEGRINYVRFQPKRLSLLKRSKMDLKTLQELLDFIVKEEINLFDYDININQNGTMVYSGQIISDNDRVVGEIIQGHCIYLAHGFKYVPLCGIIDGYSRTLKYLNNPDDFTNIAEAKTLLYTAIKSIHGFSDFPINGYFEFFVNHKGVQFYNMQEKGGFVKLSDF